MNGARKLKLGTFCTNLDYGAAMSSVDGVLRISWANTRKLAELADEMEFEALVPVGRWKGFGGQLDFNGAGFESFSWAAGIGALTRSPWVFATAHITTIHPLMAAKQATTIDHITGGRFALNVVTGWNRTEMEMFGNTMPDHKTRYAMAAEWLTVIKRLWTEEEPVDFAGEFYNLKGAVLRPKPLQQPHPPVMCAGHSPQGMDFSARYCDMAFVGVQPDDPAGTRANVANYRKTAQQTYGREIELWTQAYLVMGDTEREARNFLHHYVDECGDWEGATNLVTTLGIESTNFTPEQLELLKRHLIGGWGGYPIVGTREHIVDELSTLANDFGLDGVLITCAKYEEGLTQFRDSVLPLLKQAGLR